MLFSFHRVENRVAYNRLELLLIEQVYIHIQQRKEQMTHTHDTGDAWSSLEIPQTSNSFLMSFCEKRKTFNRWITMLVETRNVWNINCWVRASPRCRVGTRSVHIDSWRAPLCQLETWWSSIWYALQIDHLSLTSRTCTAGQHCCHSRRSVANSELFRSKINTFVFGS